MSGPPQGPQQQPNSQPGRQWPRAEPPPGLPPQPGSGSARTAKLVALIAVIALVIGSGAFAASMFFFGRKGAAENQADPGGQTRTASTPPAETAPPIAPATLEEALVAQRFACYQTVSEPVEGRSCYRSEADGIQLVVRILSGTDGKVARVAVHTKQATAVGTEPRQPGDAARPMRETVPLIATTVLGPEASKVPSAQIEAEGRRQVNLGWGSVSFDIRPESGTADFSRPNAPKVPADTPFSKDRAVLQAGMKTTGYDCDGNTCNDLDPYRVRVTFSPRDVSMTVERYEGPRVTDAELTKRFGHLLAQVAGPGARPEAEKWLASQLKPVNGSAQADLAGVHAEIARDDSGSATLVLTPASME